jgi:hypothetical protein
VRQILTLSVFVLILGGAFVVNRVVKPPDVSQSERRPLAKMPEFSQESFVSADFMDSFEDYAADSFAMRDGFRTLRAAAVFYVFAQTDKSGLYFDDSGAGKFERSDTDAIGRAAAKMKTAADDLTERGVNVYYSLVPDKSAYTGRGFPGFDRAAAEAALAGRLADYVYIPIADVTTESMFYRTDLHWDQADIKPIVKKLGDAMGVPVDVSAYATMTAGQFEGVYPGQLALPIGKDICEYLVPPGSVAVEYLNERTLEWEPGEMYDTAALAGRDPYDIFLGGARAMIRIKNPEAATDRELFLFRDSFGSSLAPLLAASYQEITLIDLRYVDWDFVPALTSRQESEPEPSRAQLTLPHNSAVPERRFGDEEPGQNAAIGKPLLEFVAFPPKSDALFIYSGQILNHPDILLVD